MYKILTILLLLIGLINGELIKDSSKIFEIKWTTSSIPKDEQLLETLNITSSIGEKYSCVIPSKEPVTVTENPSYKGPLAIDFIEHLFEMGICSYRLDPYWTYEVCHGKYIKQYHEILDHSRLRLQQHTLGRMEIKEQEIILRKLRKKELKMNKDLSAQLPTKKIDNVKLPYIEIVMSGGSHCEFNKRKLRKSYVYYVCDLKGNNDIHSVKEIAYCKYEIVILTPLLCAHPKYRPKKVPKNIITCYAKEKTPKIPYNLAKIYSERKRIINEAFQGEGRIEFVTYDKKSSKPNSDSADPISISNFLSGKNCISGGTGSWKYEFCYGKYINQYTYGMLGLKTTVCLGKFNLNKHIDWMRNHPYKRPKPVKHRNYITQFYTDGCVSNVTGRPRQTEVKLKCMENFENWNSLVMYLYETNFGEYLLGIESPILCHVIPMADDDGLIFFKT